MTKDIIYTTKTHLIIEVPGKGKLVEDLMQPVNNYYEPNDNTLVPAIIGLIEGRKKTFNHSLDMRYCGKPQQIGSEFYLYDGKRKDFIELCKKLKIEYYECAICAYCKRPLYGSFTWGDKGNRCYSCQEKEL